MGETLETFGWSLCQIDVYREFERRNHKCSFGLYLANECLVSFAGCNRLSGVLGVCKGPSMRMGSWELHVGSNEHKNSAWCGVLMEPTSSKDREREIFSLLWGDGDRWVKRKREMTDLGRRERERNRVREREEEYTVCVVG